MDPQGFAAHWRQQVAHEGFVPMDADGLDALLGRLTGRLGESLSSVPFDPRAAAEVGAALVELAAGAPRGRVADLGGPEEHELADLVRRWLAATRQRRRVLRVPLPGSFGRRMRDGSLLPGPTADRGRQTFAEWLAVQ